MLAERLDAQLLSRPSATTADEVVERLLAVQAQDPRGMRLAVRARSTGLTSADVEHALDGGRLVVSWLNRGTLHLVRAEDHWRLFALTTPQLWTGSRRRLQQEGVDERQADRGVDVLAAAVDSGPKTRAELRAELERAGVPTAGQALVHLLFAASLRGLLVRGPMRGGDQAFVSAVRWLGPAPDFDEAESLTWLGRRYLAGHGPAGARDLAKWANIPVTKARQALTGLADQVRTGPDQLLDMADREPAAPLPAPRLLGTFEPVLLGWADRTPIVGAHAPKVTVGGMFRSFALVDGRVVATWQLKGKRLQIDYAEPVGDDDVALLERDGEAVRTFLGG